MVQTVTEHTLGFDLGHMSLPFSPLAGKEGSSQVINVAWSQ